jgi:hypothetical protein
MVPAAGLIKVSLMRLNLWISAFGSSHLRVSGIYARLFRETPLPQRKLMRMQRFSPA